jgi:hypothetical protein
MFANKKQQSAEVCSFDLSKIDETALAILAGGFLQAYRKTPLRQVRLLAKMCTVELLGRINDVRSTLHEFPLRDCTEVELRALAAGIVCGRDLAEDAGATAWMNEVLFEIDEELRRRRK